MQRTARQIRRDQEQLRAGFLGIERGMTSMMAVARSAAGVLGVGLGAAGLGRLTRDAISSTAALGDMAARLQVSASRLQSWRREADVSGSSARTLDQGFEQLTRRIGEAAVLGRGDAAEAFRVLGVELVDQAGRVRDTESVFLDLADAIAALPTAAERSALAARVLGRTAGPELVSLLARGGDALRRTADEAVAAGRVIDDSMVETARRLNDRWSEFANTLDVQVKTAILGVVDTADRLARSEGLSTLLEGLGVGTQVEGLTRDVERLNRFLEFVQQNLAALRAGMMPGEFRALADLGDQITIRAPLEVDVTSPRGVTGGLLLAHEAAQASLAALNRTREQAVQVAEQQAAAEAALAATRASALADIRVETTQLEALLAAAQQGVDAHRELERAIVAENAARAAGFELGTAQAAAFQAEAAERERLIDAIGRTVGAMAEAARMGAELEALAGGPMGALTDELERIAGAAAALPEAFSAEGLAAGFQRAGEQALRMGVDSEQVMLQLRLMGDEGALAAARIEESLATTGDGLADFGREWQFVHRNMEHTASRTLAAMALDFENWRSTASSALQSVSRMLLEFGLHTAMFGSGGGGGGGFIGALLGLQHGGRVPMVAGAARGRDSVLAALEPGEFVMNRRAADQFGPMLEQINQGGLPGFSRGGLVGYQGGGLVTAAPDVAAAGGDTTTVNLTVHVDARGAGPDVGAIVEAAAEMGARRGVERMMQAAHRNRGVSRRFGGA